MKHTNKHLFFTASLFALMSICVSCKKSLFETVFTPCGPLPCPTSSGKNVISFMFDNQHVIVKGKDSKIGMFTCTSGNAITIHPNYCEIEVFKCPEDQKSADIRSVYISIYEDPQLKTYVISNPKNENVLIDFDSAFSFGRSDSSTKGIVTFHKVSSTVIAGSFEFTIKDNNEKWHTFNRGNFDLSR
jgi:hypothetical protein